MLILKVCHFWLNLYKDPGDPTWADSSLQLGIAANGGQVIRPSLFIFSGLIRQLVD